MVEASATSTMAARLATSREAKSPAGSLYVVSTPIGNLRDITLRAIDVAASASISFSPRTRGTRDTCSMHHGIETRMISYHEHNEARATATCVGSSSRWARRGADLRCRNAAACPIRARGWSAPRRRLVFPSFPFLAPPRLLAALVASALGSDRFTFFGFLARKGRERDEALRDLSSLRTQPYSTRHRTASRRRSPSCGAAGAGARRAVVARELTKQFEEIRRGTVAELAAYYESSPPRGEVVIVLEGFTPQPLAEDELRSRARSLRAAGLSARDVAAALVREDGASRNLAYRLAHEA